MTNSYFLLKIQSLKTMLLGQGDKAGGLYYKRIMLVNDVSRVMLKLCCHFTSVIDDCSVAKRGIFYNCNMLIVPATVAMV